jgi:hypothetical protein
MRQKSRNTPAGDLHDFSDLVPIGYLKLSARSQVLMEGGRIDLNRL